MARWLGIDYGRRRIGVALSDPLGITARPLETLDLAAGVGGRPGPAWRASPGALGRAATRLAALCAEWQVAGLVVGEPRTLGGQATDGAAWIEARVGELRAALDEAGLGAISIHRIDERGSTEAAARALEVRGARVAVLRRAGQVDAAAAAVILQQFLSEHPSSGGLPDADEEA